MKFIQNLEKYVNRENISSEWIFSKIDETLDEEIGIPHFYRKDNRYRIFFLISSFGIDCENKIDDFEKLFLNLNTPHIYKGLSIKFDLRFYNDDTKSRRGKT
ncbi:hypothetical protein ATZ36_00870 [Candidatus Endomicrobiellum trichonymphae]|uniref:Uncharacterized protein n=1 Tax=Endomicrobium trichonymphae TaxID=1408204 RepID=A0A1E5IJ01_ENDTX|nr:hypothetical protein ATZ36_00870 [Candidatus Endomicrobium trichonymphae]